DRVIAAVSERERVEHEARERRESAEDADEDEGSHFGRHVNPTHCEQAAEQADRERPDDVDGRRCPRNRPFEHVSEEHVHLVTRQRAKRAANTNRQPDHEVSSKTRRLDIWERADGDGPTASRRSHWPSSGSGGCGWTPPPTRLTGYNRWTREGHLDAQRR